MFVEEVEEEFEFDFGDECDEDMFVGVVFFEIGCCVCVGDMVDFGLFVMEIFEVE